MSFTPEPLLHSPPGKPGCWSSLRRCGEGHPEKQMTIAKQIQSRQADVPHPLVYRRTYAPFASAPCAPGCRGGAPPRSFPGFSRGREIGPPEANQCGQKEIRPPEANVTNTTAVESITPGRGPRRRGEVRYGRQGKTKQERPGSGAPAVYTGKRGGQAHTIQRYR